MSSRNFALLALVIIAVALRSIYAVDDVYGSVRTSPSFLGLNLASPSRPLVKLPVVEESNNNFLDKVCRSLGIDKELVIYGSIGAIGVFLMVLASSSAVFNSKSRAEAQLEMLIQEK